MPGNSLISVLAAGLAPRVRQQTYSSVPSTGGGWFGLIREAWAGAWQQNIVIDGPRDILSFSGVFAPLTLIASDIAKLRIRLVEEDENDICVEIKTGSPFLPVLRKPNHFQTRIKLIEQWIVSKLLWGNSYAIKERDARGIVTALYMLDPQRVTPLVAESGDVYYRLSADHLSGLKEGVVVPATEIIHDRMVCLWHPLVGIPPIYACALSATMGNKIQKNSTKFFENMSRPSGMLTAPGSITDEVANRMKAAFEQHFGGANVGRLAVAGDGLKYEPMTMPAQEAQLIEQLKWTVEDIARCFHVPLYKVGGPIPIGSTIEALQTNYYNDCLHPLIESLEASLDEGLNLRNSPETANYYTDLDLTGLMRMDTAARYEAKNKAVAGAWMSPNEARAGENLKPVTGGESPMIQQQNYSLAAISKRDASDDPFANTNADGTRSKPADSAANDEEAAAAAHTAGIRIELHEKKKLLPDLSYLTRAA